MPRSPLIRPKAIQEYGGGVKCATIIPDEDRHAFGDQYRAKLNQGLQAKIGLLAACKGLPG